MSNINSFSWDTTKTKKDNIFNLMCQLLVVSLFFTNLIYFRHIGNKIQLTEIVFLLTIPFIPFKQVLQYQRSTNLTLIKLVLLYLAFDLTSSILSHQTPAILESLGRCYLFTLFLILSYQFNTLTIVNLLKRITYLLIFSAIGLLLFSAYGYLMLGLGRYNPYIMRFVNYPYFGTLYRLRGPTIHPSMLISLTSLLLIFFIGTFCNQVNKKNFTTLIILLFGCALLTISKSILLLVFGALMLFLKNKNLLNKRVLTASAIFITLLMLISTHFIFVSKHSTQLQKLQSTNFISDKVLYQNSRFEILETVYLTLKKTEIRMAIEHPFFGVGTGNFNKHLAAYKRIGLFPKKLRNFDPHSTYLGAMVENGLFAFIMLMVVLGYIFIRFIKNDDLLKNNLLLTLFLIYFTFLVDGLSTDILNFRHLWFFIALAIVCFNKAKQASSHSDYHHVEQNAKDELPLIQAK